MESKNYMFMQAYMDIGTYAGAARSLNMKIDKYMTGFYKDAQKMNLNLASKTAPKVRTIIEDYISSTVRGIVYVQPK